MDGQVGRTGGRFSFPVPLSTFAGARLCVQGCIDNWPLLTAQPDKSIKRREDEEEQQRS